MTSGPPKRVICTALTTGRLGPRRGEPVPDRLVAEGRFGVRLSEPVEDLLVSARSLALLALRTCGVA
jgi:hypothetical protein